jgi:hypothetical protein
MIWGSLYTNQLENAGNQVILNRSYLSMLFPFKYMAEVISVYMREPPLRKTWEYSNITQRLS